MIAGEHRIGPAGILQHLHRRIGDRPLLRMLGLIDDVAEMDGERNMIFGGVVDDELRLRRVGRAAILALIGLAFFRGRVAGIELRVGQDGEREAGRDMMMVMMHAPMPVRMRLARQHAGAEAERRGAHGVLVV